MATSSGNLRKIVEAGSGRGGVWHCGEEFIAVIRRSPWDIIVAVHANCGCKSGGVKDKMDLALLFLERQGLAGWPLVQDRPTRRSQGSSRRSGRFPALPYPPLEQIGVAPTALKCRQGECVPFPFPWGPIGGERETAVAWRARWS